MYTVKELIETLKQCPEDYEVAIVVGDNLFSSDEIGLNHDTKTVDIFSYPTEE